MAVKTYSIRDIAKLVEVSPSTVSRVLGKKNNKIKISDTTRKKIIETAEKLNYAPNIHAKRLFAKHTGVIGFLTPSYHNLGCHIFEDNHLVRMLSGIEKGLSKNKFNILLLFSDKDFIKEKKYVKLFREKQIDGLLIWGASIDDTHLKELGTNNYPHIFLATEPDCDVEFNSISFNYEDASYKVAEHVIKKGHKKIAWLCGAKNNSVTVSQEKGLKKAFDRYNLVLDEKLTVSGNFRHGSGYAATKELLDRNLQFTALISANCTMGLEAINLFKSLGFSIPQDIAVATCDSTESVLDKEHPLTTVKTPDVRIGELAAERIIQLIHNEDVPAKTTLDLEFMKGKTT
jgi:DNA-binding LacI/PurR family transcriptional regulator